MGIPDRGVAGGAPEPIGRHADTTQNSDRYAPLLLIVTPLGLCRALQFEHLHVTGLQALLTCSSPHQAVAKDAHYECGMVFYDHVKLRVCPS